MTALLEAALGYAEAGWPVFPVIWRDKAPLTDHGFKDASTDPDVIRSWWRRWPIANVAVATGAPGPDVLDVDTKSGRGGMELFDRARRAGLVRGAAAIIRTPSGGLHLWFVGTDQPGGAVGADRALELKARGGYVLLPPSYVEDYEHGYADHYELIERRVGNAGTVDFAAIRRLLQPPAPSVRKSARPSCGHGALVRWLESQGQGNRNKALYWAACTALETGAGRDVLDALQDVAVAIGLTEHEVVRTIESATGKVTGGRP